MSNETAYDVAVAVTGVLLGGAAGLLVLVFLGRLRHVPASVASNAQEIMPAEFGQAAVVAFFVIAASTPILILLPSISWFLFGAAAGFGIASVLAASFIGASFGNPHHQPAPEDGPWASA